MQSSGTNGRVRMNPMSQVPPHDLDAERAVLGAMLVSESALSVIGDRLASERDFYSENHRIMYRGMMNLYSRGEPIDQLTLSDELRGVDEFDKTGGREYLFKLAESVPTAGNAGRYAEIVRGKSLLRSVIDAGSRLQLLGFNDDGKEVYEVLDEAEQRVYDLSDQDCASESGLVHPHDGAMQVLAEIEAAQQSGGGMTGISSGFEDIDDMTLGFDPGDLVVIAARPAMGKTALALNICWHISRNMGVPTAMFSMEMSKEQLYKRLIAIEARVSLKDMLAGQLKAEDWPRVVRAQQVLKNTPIYVDDGGHTTVTAMRARVRRLNSRLRSSGQALGLVAVDYLGLMSTIKDHDSLYFKVSEISRNLKIMARDLEIPVLALAQLNRELEKRDNKRPKLSDLRDSGSIEQDADIVMSLYRDEIYDTDSPARGEAELIIGKQRNGPTGTVRLVFIESQTRFGSLMRGV